MAEIRTFHAPGIDQGDVARKVSSWLVLHDFEARIVDLPDGRTTVQARQPKSWRYILGMSSALNITISTEGGKLAVETDAGQWAEKVAVGAVGVFILHPLLITMAYGTWKQMQLPEKVFEVIEQYIRERQGKEWPGKKTQGEERQGEERQGEEGKSPASATRIPVQSSNEPTPVTDISETASAPAPENVPSIAPEETVCANCGKVVDEESKYCDQCGARLKSTSVTID
jgi:hypothetical protein